MANNPSQGGRPTGRGTKAGRQIRVAKELTEARGAMLEEVQRDFLVPATRPHQFTSEIPPGARAITDEGKLKLAKGRERVQRDTLLALNRIVDLQERPPGAPLTGPSPGSRVETLDGRYVGTTLVNGQPSLVSGWQPTNLGELDAIERLLTEGKTTELELIGASGVSAFAAVVERRWGTTVERRAKATDAIADLLAIWERWGTKRMRQRLYTEISDRAAEHLAKIVAPGTRARFVADEEYNETRILDLLEKFGPGAQPVWVAPWVCDLMEESLRTFPDVPFRKELVPYQAGLVRFASPLPVPEITGEQREEGGRTVMASAAKLRAIFWCAGKPIRYDGAREDRLWERYVGREIGIDALLDGVKDAGIVPCALAESESLYLIAFREQEGRVYRDEFADVPLPLCFSSFAFGDLPTRHRDIVADASNIAYLHAQEKALDGQGQPVHAQVRRNHIRVEGLRSAYVHRYLDMLLSFMSEKIAPSRDEPVAHRGQAREYRRRGLKDTIVKVVNLREVEQHYVERDTIAEIGEGRKLTDRHWVRPHWRRYHHKEGVVRHYLAPFLRGPDGTPIREPQWTLTKVAR